MTPAGSIRPARPDDVAEIHQMIVDLADYERARDAVVATVDDLTAALFGGSGDTPAPTDSGLPAVRGLVVDHPDGRGGRLGGFALWFLTYSTWLGRHGIYLEDLYVRPELRGRGYGRGLLAWLAAECRDRGYRRLEWSVLDWNEPARGFYDALGAQRMDEWTVHRLDGDRLTRLAGRPEPGP